MDKRKTRESEAAHRIFNTVRVQPKPFSFSFVLDDLNMKLVRGTLRKLMRDKRQFDDVSTRLNPNGITVYTKQESYEARLVRMLRRTLLHVDDEGLYDDALRLLEERHGNL